MGSKAAVGSWLKWLAMFDGQVACVVDGLQIGGAHDAVPAVIAAAGVDGLAAFERMCPGS
jgi:hypothetical protein